MTTILKTFKYPRKIPELHTTIHIKIDMLMDLYTKKYITIIGLVNGAHEIFNLKHCFPMNLILMHVHFHWGFQTCICLLLIVIAKSHQS
jgi:hypothetical protein